MGHADRRCINNQQRHLTINHPSFKQSFLKSMKYASLLTRYRNESSLLLLIGRATSNAQCLLGHQAKPLLWDNSWTMLFLIDLSHPLRFHYKFTLENTRKALCWSSTYEYFKLHLLSQPLWETQESLNKRTSTESSSSVSFYYNIIRNTWGLKGRRWPASSTKWTRQLFKEAAHEPHIPFMTQRIGQKKGKNPPHRRVKS